MRSTGDQGWKWGSKSHNEINTICSTGELAAPSVKRSGKKGALLSPCSDRGNQPGYLLLPSELPSLSTSPRKADNVNYSFTPD